MAPVGSPSPPSPSPAPADPRCPPRARRSPPNGDTSRRHGRRVAGRAGASLRPRSGPSRPRVRWPVLRPRKSPRAIPPVAAGLDRMGRYRNSAAGLRHGLARRPRGRSRVPITLHSVILRGLRIGSESPSLLGVPGPFGVYDRARGIRPRAARSALGPLRGPRPPARPACAPSLARRALGLLPSRGAASLRPGLRRLPAAHLVDNYPPTRLWCRVVLPLQPDSGVGLTTLRRS